MNKIKLEYHQEIDNKIVKKELEFEEDLIKIPIEIIITTDTKSKQYFALKNGI